MKYPKWRELETNPFDILYKNIKINKITGYLPAGNDVISVIDSKNRNLIIKIERSKVACFDVEYKHLELIKQNKFYDKIPNIIEYGIYNNKKYIVEIESKGKRLPVLLEKNKNNKHVYLYKLGEELSKIHAIPHNNFDNAKIRIINDVPSQELFNYDDNIIPYIDYLRCNDIDKSPNSFIHGDFHYANILWRYNNISTILDFEYSGFGLKEQDIAWALVVRPNQKFLNSIDEIQKMLEGYSHYGNYDSIKLKWCLINGYTHFYLMNKDDEYRKNVLCILNEILHTDF